MRVDQNKPLPPPPTSPSTPPAPPSPVPPVAPATSPRIELERIEIRGESVSDESGSGMSVDLSTLRGSRVLDVVDVDVGVDVDVKDGDGDQLYRIRDDQSNGSWLGDAGDPALPLSSDLEGFSPIGECLCVCVCI